MGGRSGNLRAFIGFDSSDDPAGDLKKFLFENIRMSFFGSPTKKKAGWLYKFEIFKPTLTEVYANFPYPEGYIGGSWVRGIEYGMSNLNYYLFTTKKTFENSRSGNAIQSKNIVRSSPTRSSGVKYVSEILELFK